MNQSTRVLFVDDEPLVLRTIDRMLRLRRVPWQARYAHSAKQALALLAAEPIDVVITDLRMPIIDGGELLAEVRDAYPHVARLVLSGQFGGTEGLSVLRVAHQCLAKPCDIDVLRTVVERISWGNSLVIDDTVADRARRVACLPSPPRTYLAVTEALRRDTGLAEVARVVQGDVALTAKLLQMVNSALFARGRRVTSVEHALVLLGTDVVRGLLLGAEVFRSFEGGPDGVARVEALQRHSGFVAQLARALAPPAVTGEAFIAGVLHDVGRLILIDLDREDGDHARTGAFLVGLWGIAAPIVDAVAFHHDPSDPPDPQFAGLIDALHLAEIVTGELEAAAEGRDDAEAVSDAWRARNGEAALERARGAGRQLWSAT